MEFARQKRVDRDVEVRDLFREEEEYNNSLETKIAAAKLNIESCFASLLIEGHTCLSHLAVTYFS